MPPSRYAHLTFNSPLSSGHADRLAAALAARNPQTMLDLGCGWGEFLLRLLRLLPDAVGVGVDHDEPLLARARAAAGSARVAFATAGGEPSDLVICSGASQIFGTPEEAFPPLFDLVLPGGVLLFGEGFWDAAVVPSDDPVAQDMATMSDLPDLVDAAVAAGFRPLRIETASAQEWEEFESGYLADWEEWLMLHPDDTEARERAEEHRASWLRGYRRGLGYAYLTLGRPSFSD